MGGCQDGEKKRREEAETRRTLLEKDEYFAPYCEAGST